MNFDSRKDYYEEAMKQLALDTEKAVDEVIFKSLMDCANNQTSLPPEFEALINKRFWEII